MEAAARLTLDHPMASKCIGCELWFSEGPALCHLGPLSQQLPDNALACFQTFALGRQGFDLVAQKYPVPCANVLPRWFFTH